MSNGLQLAPSLRGTTRSPQEVLMKFRIIVAALAIAGTAAYATGHLVEKNEP